MKNCRKIMSIARFKCIVLFCIYTFNGASQLAAENRQPTAEEYAEKSKDNYIIAAVCFAVVIAGGIFRHYANKPPGDSE
jgi:cytochrome bd-type quinol oxidase subunit 2